MKSVDDKKMVTFGRNSLIARKPKESLRIIVTVFFGIAIGFFIGISFPILSSYRLNFSTSIGEQIGDNVSKHISTQVQNQNDPSKIWVSSNPRGAERLAPAIVAAESDLYPRRLFGKPSEDLTVEPKYLVTFTVGYNQKQNIDAAVKKNGMNLSGRNEPFM